MAQSRASAGAGAGAVVGAGGSVKGVVCLSGSWLWQSGQYPDDPRVASQWQSVRYRVKGLPWVATVEAPRGWDDDRRQEEQAGRAEGEAREGEFDARRAREGPPPPRIVLLQMVQPYEAVRMHCFAHTKGVAREFRLCHQNVVYVPNYGQTTGRAAPSFVTVVKVDPSFTSMTLRRLGPAQGQRSMETYFLADGGQTMRVVVEITLPDGQNFRLQRSFVRAPRMECPHPVLFHGTTRTNNQRTGFQPRLQIFQDITVSVPESADVAIGETMVRFFHIVVSHRGLLRWTVTHRYSEFDALRIYLERDGMVPLPRLPGKTIIKPRGAALQTRARGLEAFLQELLNCVLYDIQIRTTAARRGDISALQENHDPSAASQAAVNAVTNASRSSNLAGSSRAANTAYHGGSMSAAARANHDSSGGAATNPVISSATAGALARSKFTGPRGDGRVTTADGVVLGPDGAPVASGNRAATTNATLTTVVSDYMTGATGRTADGHVRISDNALLAIDDFLQIDSNLLNATSTGANTNAEQSFHAQAISAGITAVHGPPPDVLAEDLLLDRLYGGMLVTKHGRVGRAKKKILRCDEHLTKLYWHSPDEAFDPNTASFVPLVDVIELRQGDTRDPSARLRPDLVGTAVLRRSCRPGKFSVSFSLICFKRTVDITCESKEDFGVLFHGLSMVIRHLQVKKHTTTVSNAHHPSSAALVPAAAHQTQGGVMLGAHSTPPPSFPPRAVAVRHGTGASPAGGGTGAGMAASAAAGGPGHSPMQHQQSAYAGLNTPQRGGIGSPPGSGSTHASPSPYRATNSAQAADETLNRYQQQRAAAGGGSRGGGGGGGGFGGGGTPGRVNQEDISAVARQAAAQGPPPHMRGTTVEPMSGDASDRVAAALARAEADNPLRGAAPDHRR